MIEFVNWYLTSLAEFWSTAIRIGLPQLLLVILLICWIRRRRCGKPVGRSCCWMWSCGSGSDDSDSGGCQVPPCGCICGRCGYQAEAAEGGDEDGDS